MNKWHYDHLLTHIAALSLIVDDFETDTSNLRDDLNVKVKEIERYFREVGAKVSLPTEKERTKEKWSKGEGALHKIARLKLPLDFPKQRKIPLRK